MVGLDKFKEAFSQYSDNCVIIGGTACEIVMRGTAIRPRATHDVDMIVVVERMTPEFGQRFWDFISEGGYSPEKYKVPDKGHSKYQLYRFVNGRVGYPEMIELLSRHPDVLGEPRGLVIEPIPIDDEVSSLSAIIMDDDFYHFTIANSTLTDGIRHASPVALIALKAKAYLNLLSDKARGLHVNTRNIKKHRSDVMKSVVIVEEDSVSAPSSVVQCVREFVAEIRNDYENLAPALAKALDAEPELVGQLLEQLEILFVEE